MTAKMKHQNFYKGQKGFNLIELMVVVVIIGLLGAMVVRSVNGSTDPANAGAIRGTASELTKAVGYLHANLGTGLSTTSNPLQANGLNMMDVLLVGSDAVHANYLSQYERAKMRPLEGDIKVIKRPAGSSPGEYEVVSYPVTFVTAGCKTGRVCVKYENVPTSTAQELAGRYGIDNFTPNTALSNGPLDITAVDGNGYHEVVISNVP